MKKGVLYALITAILFVTLEPVSKLIAGDVNPFAITFLRFLIGSFILIPPAIVKVRKEKLNIKAKDFIVMILLGILFICISMPLLQVSVKEATNPSLMAIIFSSNSVFTILFARFIIKEKITRNKAIALICGIIGVIFCADFTKGANVSSVILAISAALTFSLYTALSQKFTKKFGGVIQTTVVFLTGSLILLIALLVMGIDAMPKIMFTDMKTLMILLYLGFFVTGIGYFCYFKGIEKGGAIMGSLAFFIKPILTPFVALYINGVNHDWKVFVAVAFIILASYFATAKKQIMGKK